MADGTDTNTPPKTETPPAPAVDKNVPPPADKGADEKFAKEKEELLAEIHRLREGGRDTKKERDELKAQLDKIEEDRLKEEKKYKELYEKTVKEKEEATAASRKRLLKAELRTAAAAEGILDPEAADLIDISDLMGLDEDSAVQKVKEKVTAHKAAKPQWYKSAAAAGDPPPATTGSPARPPAPAAKPGETNVKDLSAKDYQEAKRQHLKEIRRSNQR